MLSNDIRRAFSLLLALALILCLLPRQILAATQDENAGTLAIENTQKIEGTPAILQLQEDFDELMLEYFDITNPTSAEIDAKVSNMQFEDYQTARSKINDLNIAMETALEAGEATESELNQLALMNPALWEFSDALNDKAIADDYVSVLGNGTVDETVCTGLAISYTWDYGTTSASVSDNDIKFSVKYSGWNRNTTSITFTNNSGTTKILSFEYTESKLNTNGFPSSPVSIALTASGAGQSVTYSVVGQLRQNATLTLTGITFTDPPVPSYNATATYDTSLGSVTGSTGTTTTGTSTGCTVSDISVGSAVTLTATPASGATFICWYDSTGILGTGSTYTTTPSSDFEISAMFSNGNACFAVGTRQSAGYVAGFGTKYTVTQDVVFDNLADAITYATNNSAKYITPINDGIVPSGNYTIPSGVTLLIPFDDDNTLYTDAPEKTGDASYSTPVAYRTLTLADGAKLTIDGTLSLSNKVNYASNKINEASPTGNVSMIDMESGSEIIVNGSLYCWGYIIGDGTLTANSSAKIYECFQFMGYRGGDQSTDSNMKNYGVFPISQYYVQNIEVPLKLMAGATETLYTVVYASSVAWDSTASFIGSSNSMFSISSGYVIKQYDATTDRLIVDVYGDVSVSAIDLKVSSSSINSASYELPITNNMTVKINSGTITTQQDLALLPGSVFEIGANGNLTLGSGKNLYVYDVDEWGNYVYTENYNQPNNDRVVRQNVQMNVLTYAPSRGTTIIRTPESLTDASICVNGVLDASAGYIYTTNSGANIYSTAAGTVKINPGTQTETYQVVQDTVLSGNDNYVTGDDDTYVKIPITSAQLKNVDGTYVKTAGATEATTYEYVRVDNSDGEDVLGHWHKTFTVGDTRYRYFDIVATNVAVNDGLDLYFYVYDACLNENAKYTATVTKDFADGYTVNDVRVESVSESISSGDWEVYTDNSGIQYKRFKFSDISAKEMTDNINAAISLSGTPITTLDETIQAYAIRTLDAYADSTTETAGALKTALIDMLNYGADAQAYFEYNKGNLANVDPDGVTTITNMKDKYQTSSDPEFTPETISGTNLKAVSVSAKNKLMLTFYFDFGDVNPNEDGYKATISYRDYKEDEQLQTVTTFYAPTTSSYFGVDVEGISMTNGRSVVTCTVTDASGTTVGSGAFSVQGYVARNNGDVYTSLIKFVDSACAYFEAVRNA